MLSGLALLYINMSIGALLVQVRLTQEQMIKNAEL